MKGGEASKNMSEPKRLSEIEIISQSLAFMEAQKKWNEKITKPQVKTEAEKEYYKKVYGEPVPEVPLTYDQAKGLFWRTAKSLIPEYQIQDKDVYQNLVKYFFDLLSAGRGAERLRFLKPCSKLYSIPQYLHSVSANV